MKPMILEFAEDIDEDVLAGVHDVDGDGGHQLLAHDDVHGVGVYRLQHLFVVTEATGYVVLVNDLAHPGLVKLHDG